MIFCYFYTLIIFVFLFQVVHPRLYDMANKGGYNSSRSKYNQRNNRNPGNDYRNNRPQMQQYQMNKPNGAGGPPSAPNGHARPSRFSAAPTYQQRQPPTSGAAGGDKRPAAYQSQNGHYPGVNSYQPNNGYVQQPNYQAYHAAVTINNGHVHHPQAPPQAYSVPPPSAQYAYTPTVLPVTN